MSRRVCRYLQAAASLVFIVLLFAACSSDGYPVSYEDQQDPETGLSNVASNWITGCEVAVGTSDLALDANGVCACSYRAISSNDGIPYENFVALDEALGSDPKALADAETKSADDIRLIELVKNCIADG